MPQVLTWCYVLFIGIVSSLPSDFGELKLFESPARYTVETALILSDAGSDRARSLQLKNELEVRAVARLDDDVLLNFDFTAPYLKTRSVRVTSDFKYTPSLWDKYGGGSFFVHWNRGEIKNIYLKPGDAVEVVNYKKSLASLFQFKIFDGEYNETDAVGTCNVLYESLSKDIIRKFKRSCEFDNNISTDKPLIDNKENPLLTRRLTRITFGKVGIKSLLAEDEIRVGSAGAALKLRSWHKLEEIPSKSVVKATKISPLDALPSDYVAEGLVMKVAPADEKKNQDLESIIKECRDVWNEELGEGGDIEAARILVRSIKAIKESNTAALLKELRRPENEDILVPISRAYGLSGSIHAHKAIRQHFTPEESYNPAVIQHLAALAISEADPALANQLLQLGEKAKDGRVAAHALIAAAATSKGQMKDKLLNSLSRCDSSECMESRVLALGALADPPLEALMTRASALGPDSLACLRVLQRFSSDKAEEFTGDMRKALLRIVLALDKEAPLEVRAAALETLLQSAASISTALELTITPLPLPDLAKNLPDELRRLLFQRLDTLKDQHPAIDRQLQALKRLRPSFFHHYMPGTSTVLRRLAGNGTNSGMADGWIAILDSSQAAFSGLLRSSTVKLEALGPNGEMSELLALEVFARGLHSIAGGDGPSDEEAAAYLAVSAGGVRFPPITLFEGQAALLSAVWSGAGSEPTSVLKTWLLSMQSDLVWSSAGVGVSRWRSWSGWGGLSAHAQVSLWARTARAAASFSASGYSFANIEFDAWNVKMDGSVESQAKPKLDISADLDFYTDVALCVRAELSSFDFCRNSTVIENSKVKKAISLVRKLSVDGRSLSLGSDNNAACRRLAPAL